MILYFDNIICVAICRVFGSI